MNSNIFQSEFFTLGSNPKHGKSEIAVSRLVRFYIFLSKTFFSNLKTEDETAFSAEHIRSKIAEHDVTNDTFCRPYPSTLRSYCRMSKRRKLMRPQPLPQRLAGEQGLHSIYRVRMVNIMKYQIPHNDIILQQTYPLGHWMGSAHMAINIHCTGLRTPKRSIFRPKSI